MKTLRFSIALAAGLLLGSPTRAQSFSGIGQYLDWSTYAHHCLSGMTTDGRWIYAVERDQDGCNNYLSVFRITRMHPDGTGHEVLLSGSQLQALATSLHPTTIQHFTMSGNGDWVAFHWPEQVLNCSNWPPGHWYILEVATGQVTELLHNGFGAGIPTFSDDGSTMAFRGYDPETGTWPFYLSDPDGSSAVKVFDPSPYGSTAIGKLSGDGSKLLFQASASICPCPANLYLYDLVSQELRQVNSSGSWIWHYSFSYDGSRIAYTQGNYVYGVNADGSDHHVIGEDPATNVTVTRDGEYVFYMRVTGQWPYQIVRRRWDGSEPLVIDGFSNYNITLLEVPVNFDGSIAAPWTEVFPGPDRYVAAWYANPPMLTTYGYGTAGTPLTFDVGGEPGDLFVLEATQRQQGPVTSQVAAHGLGQVSLAQILGLELGSGTVQGPYNLGTIQQVLPPEIDLLGPIEVDFRATVYGDGGAGPGQSTNWTRMTLGTGNSALVSAGPPEPPATRDHAPFYDPLRIDPRTLTPEEQLRQRALLDPAIWWEMQRGEADRLRR